MPTTYPAPVADDLAETGYVVGMTSTAPVAVDHTSLRRAVWNRRPHDDIRAVRIARADSYMAERTGRYEWRAERYRAALDAMAELGLNHNQTVLDIGAGWTELDAVLRTEGRWRGRYIPVDFGVDGTDLETWTPPRSVDFVVALEIIEHLHDPWRLVYDLQRITSAVIISVPNPETTDVLGMDDDHKTVIHRTELEDRGFIVSERTFYGGFYSAGKPDALFAIWCKPPSSITHTAAAAPMYHRGMTPTNPALTPRRGDR